MSCMNVILDTNVLIGKLNLVKKIVDSSKCRCCIAAVVLTELNRMKTHKREYLRRQAQKAISFLYKNIDRIIIQSIEETNFDRLSR